jgi:hypothetical protein
VVGAKSVSATRAREGRFFPDLGSGLSTPGNGLPRRIRTRSVASSHDLVNAAMAEASSFEIANFPWRQQCTLAATVGP